MVIMIAMKMKMIKILFNEKTLIKKEYLLKNIYKVVVEY